MISFIQNCLFTFNAVAPIFLLIFLGILLRRWRFLNDDFAILGSRLVFNVSLPVMIFMELTRADISKCINFKQLGFCYAGTLSFFVIAWWLSTKLTHSGADRGPFIQGCFRSNYAIIGIPLILNVFGEPGLINAAIVLTAILPLNNILAVLALTLTMDTQNRISWGKILIQIITNPLILAGLIAIPFSVWQVPLPSFAIKTGNYLAALTIPLALLAIGQGMHFQRLRTGWKLLVTSVSIRNIIMPGVLTSLAVFIGFRDADLVAIYILFAAPTAVASFVMAEAMGANSKLAGDIVVISTLFSVVTVSLGIFILKTFGLF